MKRLFSPWARLFLLIILVAGAWLCYLFVNWANKPVEHTMQVDTSAAPVATTQNYKPIGTKYYKTKINEDYRVRNSENPDEPELAQTTLFDPSGSTKQVGITSNRLPAEGLRGVSNYIYRLRTPETYKQYTYEGIPGGGVAFKKTDNSEITLFITDGNRYASIAVSATGAPIDQLQALLDTVMENWVWIKNGLP